MYPLVWISFSSNLNCMLVQCKIYKMKIREITWVYEPFLTVITYVLILHIYIRHRYIHLYKIHIVFVHVYVFVNKVHPSHTLTILAPCHMGSSICKCLFCVKWKRKYKSLILLHGGQCFYKINFTSTVDLI